MGKASRFCAPFVMFMLHSFVQVCRVSPLAEQEGRDTEMEGSDMVLALTKKNTFWWGRQACKNQL